MMKYLSEFIKYFCIITTGITLISGLTILKYDAIHSSTLMEVVIAGAVTALVTTIFLTGEPKSKKDMLCRMGLHYISLCVIMIIMNFSFGWMKCSIGGAVSMIVSVAIVYIFTTIAYVFTSRKEVREINEALQKKYHNNDSENEE